MSKATISADIQNDAPKKFRLLTDSEINAMYPYKGLDMPSRVRQMEYRESAKSTRNIVESRMHDLMKELADFFGSDTNNEFKTPDELVNEFLSTKTIKK